MYDQRVKKVREILLEKNIDSFLISNYFNIFYLTGFKTLTQDEREAFVLITKNKTFLFSDERYLRNSSKLEVGSLKLEVKLIEPEKGLIFHLKEIIAKEQINTLGFEEEDLRFYEYRRFKEMMGEVDLSPTSKLVIRIREEKDKEEIKRIEKACDIGDWCLREITKIIKVGISEKEIALKMEMWIKEKGYDIAFDPIVAVDVNSSVAHYNTKDGNGIVKDGSVILIDFGVKYKNYLSDISRMFFLGKPNDEVINIYKILAQAQSKTVEKVTDLEFLKDIDNFCRSQLTINNLPVYPHSTGHGVGLEIHEYPKVSYNSTDKKNANQVFTIEPGVYFPGKWGMRVEDTVAVGEDLSPVILTKFPKTLLLI